MFDPVQQIIFDRYKYPRQAGSLPGANFQAEGANLSCGDEIRLEALVEEGKFREMKHTCRACAICSASVDLLRDQIVGKTLQEASAISGSEILEILVIPLSPIRIKCALLPLETLKEGIIKTNLNSETPAA